MFDLFHSKPDLIVHSQQPYNAEPHLDRLRAAYVTPQRDFYVRTHGAIPKLAKADHRLRVGGRVGMPLDLSMDDLRDRFPRRSVMAVMQCAGNRRSDMRRVRPVAGDPWAPGAIGNAEWIGIALADVLHAAGASTDPAFHVAFAACDEVHLEGQDFRYGVSIPMAKAMSPEVLLAFEMNGAALAAEHGFPLRAVVPGYAGVRSPKWLAAIEVQDAPVATPLQQDDYKLFPSDVTVETAKSAKGMVIDDMPLNSAICEPAPYAELAAGSIALRGYAVATARAVARVDVSADGGRTWHQAALEHDPAAPWSWTFWEATLDLPPGEHELVVRAWDSAGQTQPSRPDDTWNYKGYLCASWHRIPVNVT